MKHKIEELEKKVIQLEEMIEKQNLLIKEEVAKAIFHQSKAIHNRIDQFIFDKKISNKNQLSKINNLEF